MYEFQPPDIEEEPDDEKWERWFAEKEKGGYVVLSREEWRGMLDQAQRDAYAEGRKDQAEACANPLPAATVRRIWDKCQALDLDRVAFAWHVQRECARAG